MSLEKKIEAFEKAREELQAEEDRLFDSVVEEIIRKNDNVKLLICTGYTPGFNDGEPCEHSQSWDINYLEDFYEDDEEEWYDQLEGIGFPLDKVGGVILNKLPEIPWQEANKIIKPIYSVEDSLTRKHGTDFRVYFFMKDGKLTRVHEDYDCGY